MTDVLTSAVLFVSDLSVMAPPGSAETVMETEAVATGKCTVTGREALAAFVSVPPEQVATAPAVLHVQPAEDTAAIVAPLAVIRTDTPRAVAPLSEDELVTLAA